LQVWAYAKLLPQGQPLFGPPQALLNAVPQHVVRQLGDDSQHHKVHLQRNHSSLPHLTARALCSISIISSISIIVIIVNNNNIIIIILLLLLLLWAVQLLVLPA